MYFFLGLKGVLLTLFTLIYYHSSFTLEATTGVRAWFVLRTSPASWTREEVRLFPGNPGAPSWKWGTHLCLPPVPGRTNLSQDAFATSILSG